MPESTTGTPTTGATPSVPEPHAGGGGDSKATAMAAAELFANSIHNSDHRLIPWALGVARGLPTNTMEVKETIDGIPEDDPDPSPDLLAGMFCIPIMPGWLLTQDSTTGGRVEQPTAGHNPADATPEVPVITKPGADLPGNQPTLADQHLASVLGNHLHANNGCHLDGGIPDDRFWQYHWRRSSQLPLSPYDVPKGRWDGGSSASWLEQ